MVVAWPVAMLRIVFGLMYLDMALQKAPWVVSGGQRYGWLYGWIQQEIEHPTFSWYAAFLRSVVVPNFGFFGLLTFVTEVALGLGLLLGRLTRLAPSSSRFSSRSTWRPHGLPPVRCRAGERSASCSASGSSSAR